jgi:calcineurin-like phosphoesterase family protein
VTTWFTSDTHFWHRNILEYQPNRKAIWGDDIEAMNEGIIERWNSVVGYDDWVWHLGDFDMNGKPKALDFVHRLNGHIALVSGNHDKCHPLFHKNPVKLQLQRQRYLNAGFAFVVESAKTKVDGQSVMLSHFPYDGDSLESDRHDEWRLKDNGYILLHGHTHDPDQRLHDDRQIHVGMDAWDCYPVSEDQIAELMYDA